MISDYLRLAKLDDIPILLKFAKNFHSVSPYRGMRFSRDKGEEFLKSILVGAQSEGIILVALHESQPIGMLVGVAREPVFTRSRVAMELGWWIEPAFRKSRASLLIYSAYEDWAKRVGCSHVQGAYLPGVSPELDHFYQKRGYRQVESSFLKTLTVELS